LLEFFIQCESIQLAGANARRKSAFLVTGDAINIEAIILVLWPRNGGASFLSVPFMTSIKSSDLSGAPPHFVKSRVLVLLTYFVIVATFAVTTLLACAIWLLIW